MKKPIKPIRSPEEFDNCSLKKWWSMTMDEAELFWERFDRQEGFLTEQQKYEYEVLKEKVKKEKEEKMNKGVKAQWMDE